MRHGSALKREEKKPAYIDVDPTTRARMKAVRGQDTGPELRVRRALHAMGYRFRVQRKDLPGTPDVVLPRHRRIILVHGCFWHGHKDCKRARLPVKNADTWREKIKLNQQRDQRNRRELCELGWDVFIVWECETLSRTQLENRLRLFLDS
jgi:DNA mismatch endonuclease, patch repair protein